MTAAAGRGAEVKCSTGTHVRAHARSAGVGSGPTGPRAGRPRRRRLRPTPRAGGCFAWIRLWNVQRVALPTTTSLAPHTSRLLFLPTMSDVGSGSGAAASPPPHAEEAPGIAVSSSPASPPPTPSTLRPEVVQSALTFLRHPSVATAPLSQRIAFLESKGLSATEVDAAITRAGSTPAAPAPTPPYGGPPAYGYGGYGGPASASVRPGARTQSDWRDWFIMSVVGGGVGWGLYTLGRRWLYPYLQPPSSSALEADLAALNARYDAVEKQLASLDAATAAARAGIDAQAAGVAAATRDVHDALREADKREAARDAEVRQLQRQVDDVHAQLNRMFDAHKEAQKAALDGITSEVKSLKTLFVSRTAAPASPAGGPATPSAAATTTGYAPPRPSVPRPSVPSWQLEKPAAAPSIPAWQLASQADDTKNNSAAPQPTPSSPARAGAGAGPGPAPENSSTPSVPAQAQAQAQPPAEAPVELPKPTIPAWQLEPSSSPAPPVRASAASPPASNTPATAAGSPSPSPGTFPGTADGRDPAEA